MTNIVKKIFGVKNISGAQINPATEETLTIISNNSVKQITSVGNTNIIPLASLATFTGVVESNDYSDVMVHIETDQPGTLFFDFTQDGVNFDTFPFIGFAHTANIPSFHIAVKGGQSFRIRFTNTGLITQGFFRAYTYYGSFRKPNAPLGTALNDDTDATAVHAVLTGKDDFGNYENIGATIGGNLKITNHDSSTNARQIVDFNGAAKVGEAMILAGDVFGAVSPSATLWDSAGTGANVTQAGNERIQTGVGVNGSRQFQTIKRARFMGSQFNIFHGGINLPDLLNVDCCFRFGPFNPIGTSNGAYFEVFGGVTPAWNIVTVKNGTPTKVAQGAWTGNGASGFNATPGLAVYEIIYNAGTVNFFQGPFLLHTQSVGKLGATYANSYHFNVGIEVENSNGNTTNNGIEVYASVIYRLGEERGETIPRAFTATQIVKTGAGYIGKSSLSRSGSGGGAGSCSLYDGTDATGILIGRIDVGGDDVKGITLEGTFSDGLFIEISGSGTNTVTLNFE